MQSLRGATTLSSMPIGVAGCAVVAILGGCDPAPDPRYASPQATIGTLLEAYDRREATQDEIREQLASGERFELRDPASFHGAFLDYRGTVDEGLTGYVFGFVATGKDDLTIERATDRAYAYPKPSDRTRRVVLVESQRRWLISLAESVPRPVQTALRAEHARARQELVLLGGLHQAPASSGAARQGPPKVTPH